MTITTFIHGIDVDVIMSFSGSKYSKIDEREMKTNAGEVKEYYLVCTLQIGEIELTLFSERYQDKKICVDV